MVTKSTKSRKPAGKAAAKRPAAAPKAKPVPARPASTAAPRAGGVVYTSALQEMIAKRLGRG